MITIVRTSVQPVSLEEAKNHLRIDGTDQDDQINLFIKAATRAAESYLNKILIIGEVTETREGICNGDSLGVAPFSSLTFLEIDGALVSDVKVLDSEWYSEIHKDTGFDITNDEAIIHYKAGYGTTSDSIPDDIRLAILLLIADFDRNREDSVRRYTTAVQRLLNPHKIWTV